jgi:uncharacterized protein YmfQ (DUF2313 family)
MIGINDILKLTKQLLPTGRAWKVPKGGYLEKLLSGLAESEARVDNFALSTLQRILPDNADFTADDAAEWERRLGLPVLPSYTNLAARKAIILRKYQFPAGKICRQNWRYIQDQLRLCGFDVYVHENLNGALSVTYTNDFQHGFDTEHGVDTEMGSSSIDLIANQIKKGETFDLDNSRGVFFICGETYPNPGQVSPDLVETFRQLVLMMKPANSVAVLIINYVHSGSLMFVNGDKIITVDNRDLQLMSFN